MSRFKRQYQEIKGAEAVYRAGVRGLGPLQDGIRRKEEHNDTAM
jgi:hypothetical protein